MFQITGWARKAQANGLLMIPIPPDPFALPYSIKSDVLRGDPSRGDPLRGPVFVPLDTESLMGTKSYLFEGIIYYLLHTVSVIKH